MHGGEQIAAVLEAHGVPFVFTLCGGHISPILVASKRRGIRVIDVRHEATAVFAADAVARMTGTPGVAAVTAGPGATNTITAVKNAQLAGSPVVLLGGGAATALSGRGALQDIDQMALFRPHVKWAFRARRVRDLAPAIRRAFRIARDGVPGPVFVECPVDLLYAEPVVRDWYAKMTPRGRSVAERGLRLYLQRHVNRLFSGAGDGRPDEAPAAPQPELRDAAVRNAAERLGGCRRPVLVIGSQAVLDAKRVPETAAAVERLGIPCYLSGMARGLLGRDHDVQARHARRAALGEADLVLLAGVPCDFRLDYGRQIPRSAFLVSVNRGRRDLKRNRTPGLAIHGDPGELLRRLGAEAGSGADRWREWRERIRDRDRARDAEIEGTTEATPDGIPPLRLCAEIEAAAGADSVVVGDGGDFVATASYVVRPRGPLSWLDPGPFGTLGVGAGFALGAKLVRPEAEVWLLWGDGSAGYGLAELDTFVRHGTPVLAVVGNDACWTQIARAQVEILGDDVACSLRATDYQQVAEGFGARGFRVDRADRVASTLAAAREELRRGRSVLVNALIGRTDFRRGSISI